MIDKYNAIWLSHSSISDYLACPRSYFLKNIYKDPQTNHKLQIVSPALSLGVSVHEVLESLSTLPVKERFKKSLIPTFEQQWQKVSGEIGGFTSTSLEKEYYHRGIAMINRVMANPGILLELAVKIKDDLPHFVLSEKDNLILCGKLDWLSYNKTNKTVHIIDFKTGKNKEKENSLQLPIYLLLASYCQKYQVAKASYWYLQLSDQLSEKVLPDIQTAKEEICQIGKKIALARKLAAFKCPHGGCPHCLPFEKLLKGEGKKVGESSTMHRDLYLLSWQNSHEAQEEIL